MLLRITIVGYTHKQHIVSVLCNFGWILLALNLFNGCINGLVVFQFYDNGWRIHILAWNEHQVGKALARSKLTVDYIVVGGIIVGYAQNASQLVFVIIAEYAGVFIVDGINTMRHVLLIPTERRLKELFGLVYCIDNMAPVV